MKTYTTTVQKPRLVIGYDEFATNPRSEDYTDSNLGGFYVVSRDKMSPDDDEQILSIIEETQYDATTTEEHMEAIKKEMAAIGQPVAAIFPINTYEHGNIVYSLGTASGFDTSNNGFYIVTEDQAKRSDVLSKDYEKIIEQELDVYTQWANGEVYWFTLYDENGEEEISVSGIYDVEEIKDELGEEWKDENLEDYFKA